METKTVHKKTLRGTVVSDKMQDTATVAVLRYVKHPKYKKYRTLSKTFLAHNPGNTAQVGDTVTIVSVKPISKRKSFAIDASKTVSAESTEKETN